MSEEMAAEESIGKGSGTIPVANPVNQQREEGHGLETKPKKEEGGRLQFYFGMIFTMNWIVIDRKLTNNVHFLNHYRWKSGA